MSRLTDARIFEILATTSRGKDGGVDVLTLARAIEKELDKICWSDWIPYDGSGQPVPDDQRVIIRCRGDSDEDAAEALERQGPLDSRGGTWSWKHSSDGDSSDIIAYRVPITRRPLIVDDGAIERFLEAYKSVGAGGSIESGVKAGLEAAALTAQGTDDGWRDISTAPRDGTVVLLFAPESIQDGGQRKPFYHTSWWVKETYYKWEDVDDSTRKRVERDNSHWASYEIPTHWRPLPPPPARKGDGG